MAAKIRSQKRESTVAFEAISIEGGLFSADWLARVAQLNAGLQSDLDYCIPKGLTLRDEIGRYWRMAQAGWREFTASTQSGVEERMVSDNWVSMLLCECLGFDSLKATTSSQEVEGHLYPVSHFAKDGLVPVLIANSEGGLDSLRPIFGEAGKKRSAFGLVQEYLNAREETLWGIVSDGRVLRVLRDNSSLTRPAWIEVDLERMFSEERYSDFAAFWLLVHDSRFGRAGVAAHECALEHWRGQGREEGTRAREFLRDGVEEALVALGSGFLSHPENSGLRAALQAGTLTTKGYFQQLLRLVYRIIFLLTLEERGLLHPWDVAESAKSLYREGYGLRRLRDKSAKHSVPDRFCDLWESLKVVFHGLARGEDRLGLPALGGLFSADQCSDLEGKIENRALLAAVFRLSWIRDESGLARVNWRDMGPEELGSVYESLLELVPRVSGGGRAFAFARGDEAKGNARKTTGSYYTPDGLVQSLLDSALEPLVHRVVRENPGNAVVALFRLSIVDPACGSGHFLLAAARRLASHVARIHASGTPTIGQYQHALRQVVGRCIYGVDANPMAVELCRVSLWMEAIEPGRPLSFLESHIRIGNSLFGATPDLVAAGIPEEAFDAIEGDEKKACSVLRKKNKAEKAGIGPLFAQRDAEVAEKLRASAAAIEELSDEKVEDVSAKEAAFRSYELTKEFLLKKQLADTWCAAFVIKKEFAEVGNENSVSGITQGCLNGLAEGRELSPRLSTLVDNLSLQYQFFHWHLAFPEVWARGGFDCVLGNPPWERVKLQEQEFFASCSDEIANAPNAAARKRLIAALEEENLSLWLEWCQARRASEGYSQFFRQSGRFPLCGKGDVNSYAIFAEHNRSALGPKGRAGFIVPGGMATDDTTKQYFQALIGGNQLASIYHFENEEKIFPGVHNAFRFLLMTIDRSGNSSKADLLFFARQVKDLGNQDRHFSLLRSDFIELNPNTGTCPTFRSRRDAELNLRMYRLAGVLWREEPVTNPWGIRFQTMFHMSNDSNLFRNRKQMEQDNYKLVGNRFETTGDVYLPLVEAKMVHHYDHRFSTYEGATQAHLNKGFLPQLDDSAHSNPSLFNMPDYWVPAAGVDNALENRWSRKWLLGFRDITGTEKRRTVVAAILPRVAVGNTTPLICSDMAPTLIAALYANLCSFALDYAARQKVGGTHLTYNYLKQLPVLNPAKFDEVAPWSKETQLKNWILPRVLELTYTAYDLEDFAEDCGWSGPPFKWDVERRNQIRSELDAAFFHLYQFSREDVAFVLDTFWIVRKADEKAYGEYRSKRLVLEAFDLLGGAIRSGQPYVTALDPPPGDPKVTHPSRKRGETGRAKAPSSQEKKRGRST